MKLFPKIVTKNYFHKSPILDLWQGSDTPRGQERFSDVFIGQETDQWHEIGYNAEQSLTFQA